MVKRQDPKDLASTMLPFGALSDIGREGAGPERQTAQPPESQVGPKASRRRPAADPARGKGAARTKPAQASLAQPSVAHMQPAQVHGLQMGTRPDLAAEAAAAVAAPARTRAREIADRRLHVMITETEMEYLRDLARRKAGDLGRVFGDSASIGQVVRYLIHFHRESEQRTKL